MGIPIYTLESGRNDYCRGCVRRDASAIDRDAATGQTIAGVAALRKESE